MKTYTLTRPTHRDLMTFTHRDSCSNAVEIIFRMNENDVYGEPFKVNDWFGNVKDEFFRGDRPIHQADGIWMNEEARWIWDALVKHYGFFRADSVPTRSARSTFKEMEYDETLGEKSYEDLAAEDRKYETDYALEA